MRLLHTMLRVGDLDRSLAFYTGVLGMKLLRRHEYPEGKFTLAFVGYGPESEQAVLELTHNWDTKAYDIGSGYGHVALEVEDAYAACAGIKQKGGVVTPVELYAPSPANIDAAVALAKREIVFSME